MSRDAANTQDTLRQSRSWLPTPTLVFCAVACLALVIAVGLQSPAVSVGMRWTPASRRTLNLPRFEIDGPGGSLQFGIRPPSGIGLALTALAILAFLVWALLWFIRRRRAPRTNVARLGADTGVLTDANAQILQSGLAAAIQILSADGADRDLGNAVVQAWQGLQDAAAAAGLHRRPAETASEFTARILYHSRRSAEPIAVLLSLYQRVRFGMHSPHRDEIAAARHSLDVLVGLWEADFPKRRPPTVAR